MAGFNIRNALGLSFDETYLMMSIAMMSAYPDDNKSVLDKEVEEQGYEAEMTLHSSSCDDITVQKSPISSVTSI